MDHQLTGPHLLGYRDQGLELRVLAEEPGEPSRTAAWE